MRDTLETRGDDVWTEPSEGTSARRKQSVGGLEEDPVLNRQAWKEKGKPSAEQLLGPNEQANAELDWTIKRNSMIKLDR